MKYLKTPIFVITVIEMLITVINWCKISLESFFLPEADPPKICGGKIVGIKSMQLS